MAVKRSALYFGKSAPTPVGEIWLAVSDAGLAAVDAGKTREAFVAYLARRFKRPLVHDPAMVRDAGKQVQEYLTQKRRQFTLVIDWTLLRPFQTSVLQATYAIPYGETRTYKEIAESINKPRAARAVGRAEATNPMPLVLPCHRVIGCDGKLHGYGMGEGLKTKEWLLRMEGAIIA